MAQTPPVTNKPTDNKPTPPAALAASMPVKPSDAKPETAAAASAPAAADDKKADDKKANHSKVYVVVGQVLEFETPIKAEKFLNGPDAPTEYAVIRGKRVGTNKRVSLR